MLPFLKPTKNNSLPRFKNIAFSRVLKTGGRPTEFNFRRKITEECIVYDVDVSDARGNRHYFSLQKTSDSWRIREQFLPAWIAEVLPQLPPIIEEAEKLNSF